MKDLTSRLRRIVRPEDADRAPAAAPIRELTDAPDIDGPQGVESMAGLIGGTAIDEAGACVKVDRCYEAHRSHGRRPIEWFVPDERAPIGLLDTRVPAEGWSRRIVFFDIETTGLSGGAGTVAFLVGCGWFEADSSFTVRQFFLAGPSGERPMLDALEKILGEASLIVSYNGRTFDMPFMEMRWAFHRATTPIADRPHFDLLPPVRRLWGRRDRMNPGGEGCSLSAMERHVLGFHRLNDVPGFEIPARYFHFLRTGNAALIEEVLEHNRQDLVSTAAVMAHALWMVREGPEACREPSEQLAVGEVYERAGLLTRAAAAYEVATYSGDGLIQQLAWGRLATMHRRAGRYEEAASAWQRVIDLASSRHRFTPLERRAAEALAIHHEHRVRDLRRARDYAEVLGASVSGRQREHTERRLKRLARKMESGGRFSDPTLWCGPENEQGAKGR